MFKEGAWMQQKTELMEDVMFFYKKRYFFREKSFWKQSFNAKKCEKFQIQTVCGFDKLMNQIRH